jgi:signal transduction histidine kinase
MALAFAVSATGWATVAQTQWTTARPLFWVDLVLGVAAFPIAHQRRRLPLPVALVLAGFGALSALATGPGILAGVSLATRRITWQILTVWATVMLAAQVFAFVEPSQQGDSWLLGAGSTAAITGAFLLWGMYLGSRRELLFTLRDRAERAEAEQEMRVSQARLNERARIAREMHDVLAHRITLITMHAGALAYRTDLPPEQIRTTAELIQTKSHEALADLRQVLGVLRDAGGDELGTHRVGDAESVPRPQPTFGDLADLLAEAQESGMRVGYTCEVAASARMPEQVGRTVFRIVQEGLTNARKHAPGATVTVAVTGSPEDGVSIRLDNPAPLGGASTVSPNGGAGAVPGAGLGLVGLRERATLAGGTLETTGSDGAFGLRGWLPWQT